MRQWSTVAEAGDRGPVLHLVTGEYPPRPGGVSDYCAQVAAGLAARGASVHVWAPEEARPAPAIDGVTAHPIVPSWRGAGLARLGALLDGFPRPRRCVVQYVPHVWGRKGLNFELCDWLVERKRRGDEITLMVHEAFYPWRLWDKPTRWLLAAGQRWMARRALAASSRVYVSIPAWEQRLRPYAPDIPMTWLPVPSNIPVVRDEARAREVRARIAAPDQLIVGTFSTFGPHIACPLREILPRLLRDRGRVGLLLGRGGERMAAELAARHPALRGRLVAPGPLDAGSLSLHLQACTVLVQPYPDGATSRRGTLMAPLSHGAAIVTNTGHLSESLWSETACVALARGPDPRAIAEIAESLLADPEERDRLGRAARRVYDARFSVEHTVQRLLDP
jgi:glycosyltransferase involved in cell wall biosynthesis